MPVPNMTIYYDADHEGQPCKLEVGMSDTHTQQMLRRLLQVVQILQQALPKPTPQPPTPPSTEGDTREQTT
jgi:hypothetical protein